MTLIDYPGKLATTVFLSGCNLRCPWCYSSELVMPEKIKAQPKISEEYFFDFLDSRAGMIEGVVICGGEPTINRELPYFVKKIKDMGFSVKLDTNGTNPEMIKELLDMSLVDYIAMDIKAPLGLKFQTPNPNDQKSFKSLNYHGATGVKVNTDKIAKSINIIKNSGIDYEFRTTVVPGIHKKEDILQMAQDIAGAEKYYLQNFRPEKNIDASFINVKPYPEKFLAEIVRSISPFFGVCQLR